MSELLCRLGSPARLAFPGQDIVVISRAEDAHRVFFLEQDRYPKGEEYDVPGLGLRRGLVTSRGEEWRRDRSMLNPLFAKRHLAPLADTMAASAAAMVDRWEDTHAGGARIDVAHEMMAVTLDIAARTMFGAALTEGETEHRH
jgi:cytochrome P450